jgi:hypothetical protein
VTINQIKNDKAASIPAASSTSLLGLNTMWITSSVASHGTAEYQFGGQQRQQRKNKNETWTHRHSYQHKLRESTNGSLWYQSCESLDPFCVATATTMTKRQQQTTDAVRQLSFTLLHVGPAPQQQGLTVPHRSSHLMNNGSSGITA